MKDDFHAFLLQQLEDFRIHLTEQQLSVGVINGHIRVATLFVNHIHNFTHYTRFEDVSVAHATTKFSAHVKWEGLSDWAPKEVKLKLRGFIEFLDGRGVKNELVLEALLKK
jgi:hypothetical protein